MHDAAGHGDRDPRGESWQRGYADRKALLCGQAAAGGCGDGTVSRARDGAKAAAGHLEKDAENVETAELNREKTVQKCTVGLADIIKCRQCLRSCQDKNYDFTFRQSKLSADDIAAQNFNKGRCFQLTAGRRMSERFVKLCGCLPFIGIYLRMLNFSAYPQAMVLHCP